MARALGKAQVSGKGGLALARPVGDENEKQIIWLSAKNIY